MCKFALVPPIRFNGRQAKVSDWHMNCKACMWAVSTSSFRQHKNALTNKRLSDGILFSICWFYCFWGKCWSACSSVPNEPFLVDNYHTIFHICFGVCLLFDRNRLKSDFETKQKSNSLTAVCPWYSIFFLQRQLFTKLSWSYGWGTFFMNFQRDFGNFTDLNVFSLNEDDFLYLFLRDRENSLHWASFKTN